MKKILKIVLIGLTFYNPAISQPCFTDVNCWDEVDEIKRSVVQINYSLTNKSCTGVFINNASYDATKQYLMSALHCFDEGFESYPALGETILLNFRFNYETSYCGQGTPSEFPDWTTLSSTVKVKENDTDFIFSEYYLPTGAELFLYSVDESRIKGAFTNVNNNEREMFATSPIQGHKVILELFEPVNELGQSRITISNVIHGYKNWNSSRDYQNSDDCNINVGCSDMWQVVFIFIV